MGYFSNGTEGMDWEARNCERCHFQAAEGDQECPIMEIHALYNYDQFKKEEPGPTLKHILGILVPMDTKGLYALECNFFLERQRHEQMELELPEESR